MGMRKRSEKVQCTALVAKLLLLQFQLLFSLPILNFKRPFLKVTSVKLMFGKHLVPLLVDLSQTFE